MPAQRANVESVVAFAFHWQPLEAERNYYG
ncbi:putative orphan protein [Pseudoalteromonas translucida]|uniref:Orphan protein n=1 Tax=Pseudoalteromonas translucida (strain TAC 125) TaxID=326442 RepID=Q3IIA3_PSET1|nr:putative orphan protein [Pseudoalteromonas translucida]